MLAKFWMGRRGAVLGLGVAWLAVNACALDRFEGSPEPAGDAGMKDDGAAPGEGGDGGSTASGGTANGNGGKSGGTAGDTSASGGSDSSGGTGPRGGTSNNGSGGDA